MFGTVGLVFVDGGHSYGVCKSDSEKALSLVRKGGVVVWDDYGTYWPGVKKVLDELSTSARTHSNYLTVREESEQCLEPGCFRSVRSRSGPRRLVREHRNIKLFTGRTFGRPFSLNPGFPLWLCGTSTAIHLGLRLRPDLFVAHSPGSRTSRRGPDRDRTDRKQPGSRHCSDSSRTVK